MKLKGKLILAYTAGILDGEGCISVTKRKARNKRGYSPDLIVSVPNTKLWLPQWLKMNYGGSVVPRKNISPLSKLPQWKWAITGKQAAEFLKLIVPYLYIKRPEAELAIAFQTHKREYLKTEAQTALLEAERILLSKMKKG